MNDNPPCYIARCKCGCGGVIFASVILPGRERENAKETGKLIRDGYLIEQLPAADVRKSRWFCQKVA